MQPGEIHGEPFRLMKYVSSDGRVVEWVWNSRSGMIPRAIRSRNGIALAYEDPSQDLFVPDYKPKRGDRIFVNMPPEDAEALARRAVAKYYAAPDSSGRREHEFSNGDEAFAFYMNIYYGDGTLPSLVDGRDWKRSY